MTSRRPLILLLVGHKWAGERANFLAAPAPAPAKTVQIDYVKYTPDQVFNPSVVKKLENLGGNLLSEGDHSYCAHIGI